MRLAIKEDPIPLYVEESGAVRVRGTRVLLDTVITAFRMGYSAEEIVNQYPTLKLADVYSVIGYYLRNQPEIDVFLKENQDKAEELRREIEARQGSQDSLRERLLARKAAKEKA